LPLTRGVRLSTTLPVCCGPTRGEAAGRAAALGEAGADTVYFHLYDVTDLDHVRLLGAEVLPQVTNI
jgi:2-methylisocitrate lyase-like PEP mutase family enzyme